MRSRGLKCALIVLPLFIASLGNTQTQESAKKQAQPPEVPAKKSPPDTKAVLMGASRASTAKATESAAKQKAEGNQAGKDREQTEDSAVTELRSLPPDQQNQAADSKGGNADKKAKGGPLKNVHGTAYGGSGSGSGAAGASAGASTRSGKTSVYVEGQSSQTRDPRR